jgi:hypothetical protein
VDGNGLALRTVGAVDGDVLVLDDGEGLHDVFDVVAWDSVEMKVEDIKLGSYEEAALLIPPARLLSRGQGTSNPVSVDPALSA